MQVMADGTLELETSLGKLSIPNTLVVPFASSALIPLGSFLNDGATLKGLKGGENLFEKENCLILITQIVNKISLIDTPPVAKACVSFSLDPLMIHKQLSHPNSFVATKIFPNVEFSKVNSAPALEPFDSAASSGSSETTPVIELACGEATSPLLPPSFVLCCVPSSNPLISPEEDSQPLCLSSSPQETDMEEVEVSSQAKAKSANIPKGCTYDVVPVIPCNNTTSKISEDNVVK
ncbi:hypothetical protein O181_053854 [Austropuccinia psidii MF-1]|uniref:Uncharacterized protein n=1 Tax=Austropuccinia psidii MF-1 TaxID=1389203 RepID=A0A9Q3E3E3_9BASI|nr:hypothetical protein [Austropuccinia psidii MF-1]